MTPEKKSYSIFSSAALSVEQPSCPYQHHLKLHSTLEEHHLNRVRSSCSFLLLSSQPVSPYFVQFDSSYLTENGKQVLQCLDRMDESPFPKEA